MSFAGNPMRYLLSPGSGGGGQQESVVHINFTNVDTVENHSMQVTLLGATRTFTLKASPTTEAHLPIAGSGWTAARWCETIYNYILNDVQLTSHYEIELSGTTIILTGREPSADYDMTMGTSTIVGVAVGTTTGGSAGTGGTVDGVLMQVWKNGTTKIGEDYKPVDILGQVKFEVQEYIYASLLQAAPPRFHLVMVSGYYYIFNDFIMKYRAVFCDRVDGVYSQRTYSDPDNVFCYALPGGLNREDLVDNNTYNRNWFNQDSVKKKFLTWAPPSRITDKDETFSLFFAFQAPTYGQFKMVANLFNDTTGTQVDITSLVSITPWTVVEFVAGYSQLHLSTQMSGTVNKWQLYLVNENNTVISDVREFVLDELYRENVRYFRFRNSWGAYDSFRCVGVVETSVDNDREKISFASDEVETAFNAPGSFTMVKELQSFKANSGWMEKECLNYLRDFMLSADIYEIEDSRILKCLLTSKRTSLFKDKNYNYSLAFEYERGYDDFFFQGSE